jgi:hypothetical protein
MTLFLLSHCGIMAQGFSPYHTNVIKYNGYSYPYFPGCVEWEDMNYSQRLDSLQIPLDTLENISTSRLLETCLYYPFNINVMLSDDYLIGFEKVRNNFNGYAELFLRSNFIQELIDLYDSRDVFFIEEINDDYDCGQYSFDFMFLELYILESMDYATETQLNQIVSLVTTKKAQQESLEEYYSNKGIADKILNKAETLGIESKTIEFDIKLSPNPLTNNLTVSYSLPFEQHAILTIYDFNGKIIKRERLYSEEKTLTLNLENLHSGTYIYTINCGDFSKTGKLIKKL